jgi:hypothetical protein
MPTPARLASSKARGAGRLLFITLLCFRAGGPSEMNGPLAHFSGKP